MSAERRSNARLQVQRPCKVIVNASRRFVPALTRNVSVSGAMLDVQSPRLLSPGEEIGVAVAWNDAPVVRASQIMSARVVRALLGPGGVQTVAVAFVAAGAGTQLAAVA